MNKKKRLWHAFSLIELMAVVAIMGILVSLVIPRFRVFVAKSRMAEAIHNLGVIDRLQKSYNLHFQMLGSDGVWWNAGLIGRNSANSECADNTAQLKNKLGFRVEDCSRLRYFYTGGSSTDTAKNTAGGGAGNYRIYPGCNSGDDEWKIHRVISSSGSTKMEHSVDIIEACK